MLLNQLDERPPATPSYRRPRPDCPSIITVIDSPGTPTSGTL
jgi:hypothetical protein